MKENMTSFGLLQNMRKVVALVEKTFRGQRITKPIHIDSASYKSDYILIPKDQELHYSNVICEQPVKILPSKIEFPPLLKEILIRQGKQIGQHITKETKLPVRYNLNGVKNYKIVEEHETSTKDWNRQSTLYINISNECTNQL